MKYIKNKELLIALYFYFFIFGFPLGIEVGNYYNVFRILEVILIYILIFIGYYKRKIYFSNFDFLFVLYLFLGFFFWNNYIFILIDFLVLYLLGRLFFLLNYSEVVSKIILLFGFFVLFQLLFIFFDPMGGGYYGISYPFPWNIRVYNSFFLVLSIFSTWFYLKEARYSLIYLLFIFLAFLSILLDGGRSATVSYTAFLFVICVFNKKKRINLLVAYFFTWCVYFLIASTMVGNFSSISRETTSGRYSLWEHAIQCWLSSPLFGCGFYQSDQYLNFPSHPHNLFIQILSETGLVGFVFLSYVIYIMVVNIKKNSKDNYFIFASFAAIGIDLSFSGIHIYPVTQVLLAWFFVFLLKSDEFQHAIYFNYKNHIKSKKKQVFEFVFLILTFILFIYLFLNKSIFSESLPLTHPRFWEDGYKLF